MVQHKTQTHQVWPPPWSFPHHSLLWHLLLWGEMCRSLLPNWTGGGQDDGLNYLRLPRRQNKVSMRKKGSKKHHVSSYFRIWQSNSPTLSLVFPQELSTLPCTDFCDPLQKKAHPSCRAALVPGPQVADNPLIIRGLWSIQLRCVCGQGDDNVTSNFCNGWLVYL